jgi:hypothetical protein
LAEDLFYVEYGDGDEKRYERAVSSRSHCACGGRAKYLMKKNADELA